MANEATVSVGLSIVQTSGTVRQINKRYSHGFLADVTLTEGPSPGYVLATVDGTDVDLSDLTTPGLCWVKNMDDTNFVSVGIWEPDTSHFYPLLELLPGEEYVVRLSRYVTEQFEGTGTGTPTPNATLRLKANTASVPCSVEAFGQ